MYGVVLRVGACLLEVEPLPQPPVNVLHVLLQQYQGRTGAVTAAATAAATNATVPGPLPPLPPPGAGQATTTILELAAVVTTNAN